MRQPRLLAGGLSQPRSRELFDAHTQAFAAFGEVPHRGIYDNVKTAIDKVHPRKKRDANARFAATCSKVNA